ncbi:MAG: M48 family metallopeptidase [Ruminococcus sp.]|nr:M48 family metallopeptidase [Ruminococcus sp.]
MIREVKYNGRKIEYNLTRKRVRNINLRVKPDLSVSVSANDRVPLKYIDTFVISKAEFILSAIDEYSEKSLIKLVYKYSVDEFAELINELFNQVYEEFRQYNIDKPQLKMRKMKSRWGSCNYVKCIITLSTNLIYCDREQIYYVIVHEFSHLLVPNHSKDFYNIVSNFCPDYKRIRKEMNSIVLK